MYKIGKAEARKGLGEVVTKELVHKITPTVIALPIPPLFAAE